MADVTKTYLTEDWKIWTYKPFDSRFVLDFDVLDDAVHPLSGSEGTIEKIGASIASLQIQEGTAIDQGIFSSLQPASLNAVLEIKNFTSDVARQFFIGSEIWVTHANGASVNNTWNSLGKNSIYFMGRIRTFSVDVQPGSDFASVTIQATSRTEDDVNTLITITKDTTTRKRDLITSAAATQADIAFTGAALDYNFADTSTETKPFGEWITDLNTCDLQIAYDMPIIYSDTGANYMSWKQRTIMKNGYWAGTWTTFSLDEITDLTMDYSGAGAPTGVTLTNYKDPAIVYQYGTGQASSLGTYNYSATIDVKNAAQMTTIGQNMVNMTKKFVPVEITTLTATNNQNITYRELNTVGDSRWLYPVNLVPVGSVNIIQTAPYNDQVNLTVTGRTLDITPDEWTTTYQLWKGFDA